MVIMHSKSFHLVYYVLIMFLFHMKHAPGFISAAEGAKLGCIERERQALLKFKTELEDTSGVLSSWGSEKEKSDCCRWKGVGCNNRTGHVTSLDHRSSSLRGNISDSLLELRHLSYLDLSDNDFEGNPIPSFIGHLSNLRYVNLSSNGFITTGTLSYQPWNLSRLQSLDLSQSNAAFETLYFLSQLSSLEHLDLSWTNLSQAGDWLKVISNLPQIKVVKLNGCWLSTTITRYHVSLVTSKSLAVLKLNSNNLSPSILNSLSNFSRSLVSLDLRFNWEISAENLDWFPHLSSLEHLDMSGNNLSKASDWLQVFNKLPHLKQMWLSRCSLSTIVPPNFSFTNSSKFLAVLDLSENNLGSSILPWLSNFSNSLVELDLSTNQLQGSIPDDFRNMSALTKLDLSVNQLQGISRSFQHMCNLRALNLEYNNLNGLLPQFFQNMSGCMENSLKILALHSNELHGSLPDVTRFPFMIKLDLSVNKLNGTLPKRFSQRSQLVSLILSDNQLTGSLTDVTMLSVLKALWIDSNRLDGTVSASIGSLSELEELHVSGSSLRGMISEAHFSNLSKLRNLDLSGNSLVLNFGSNWTPTFQLDSILLGSCTLGPHFPKWLRNQNNFHELDMSGAGISDTIPNWFWDLSNSKLGILNLSNNQMRGILPDLSSKYHTLSIIDLSFNQFEGSLPHFPSNGQSFLDLSNNMFSGPVSLMCKINVGLFLDLSNNLLSGRLADDCFMHLEGLQVISLADNNISGEIPSSVGSLSLLQTFSLRNNSFSGKLPQSLKNCVSLSFLDLSANELYGGIPAWIGKSFPSLEFLSIRSNKFSGKIPPYLCLLTNMKILDLSQNNISGIIPKCLSRFTDMVQKVDSSDMVSVVGFRDSRMYINKAWVGWKGRDYEYGRNLGLFRLIDFAGNQLIGEIPEEITGLLQLVALNLSGNNLSGVIPQKIGQLEQLESFDLSGNHLSGVIPITMADLHFLNYLNLSYNNLSGKIPSSTQLQSFDASAFTGNPALCGLPIAQKCPGDEMPRSPSAAKDDNQGNEPVVVDEFRKWFYTAMGIGFGVFFWGVSCALLLNSSWRNAYFRLLDESWDWLYVIIAVRKAQLQRKFQRLLS